MIPEIFRFLFGRRPWPEVDVIISSLDNEPDKWEPTGVGRMRGPLSVRLENALDYKVLGLEAYRNGSPIPVPMFSGLREAVSRWEKRRAEISKRRLLQDDHTARVQRISEFRIALHREENAHIQGQLK